jgi:ATP-dependent protease ClpP protease subunit
MKFIAILTTTLLLMSGSALARTVTVDQSNPNVITIEGPIDSQSLRGLGNRVLEQSLKSKSITLLINSPGGEVYSGLNFIGTLQMAKHRGVELNCVVSTVAASMAFQILSYCDNRYVLRNAFLLWHPVRIGFMGSVTPVRALEMYNALSRIETTLVKALRKNIDMPDDMFWEHYNAETLWVAEDLAKELPGEFILIDDIKGVKSLNFRGSSDVSDYQDLNIFNWR